MILIKKIEIFLFYLKFSRNTKRKILLYDRHNSFKIEFKNVAKLPYFLTNDELLP